METRILLQRQIFTEKSTIGKLYINGVYECWTLEDTVRLGPKVKGTTAIPYGEYSLTIDFSNRFKRMMPHILNVPNFEGIRIHWGNSDVDTEGCPLLGRQKAAIPDKILQSVAAFDAFFPKLESLLKLGRVFIEIAKEGQPSPYSG